MDDQTRGEAPGTGPESNVPLKRDRKRLRSSEPWPARTRTVEEPSQRSDIDQPEELQEPELSPVEQLFASQWTATLPAQGMPASTIPPEPATVPSATVPPAADVPANNVQANDDLDLTEGRAEAPAEKPKRRFGLGKSRTEPADPVEAEHVTDSRADFTPPRRDEPEPARTVPYVPPGGFSSPGHPRLGPLAPMPLEKHRGLAGLDVAALIAAVIVPPVGLITAIVAIIRGKQLRGWASDLARAAVSVALVMTVVFAGVGGYIWIQETERAEQLAAVKAEQRAHDLVATSSQPFCEVLAANPSIYSTADPDYGWPAVDAPGGYNAAISEYAKVWAQLAEVAPEGIAEETAAISERVAGIVEISNALRSSNRAGDLLGLHAETDLATVESWYVEYCDAPEATEQPEAPEEP